MKAVGTKDSSALALCAEQKFLLDIFRLQNKSHYMEDYTGGSNKAVVVVIVLVLLMVLGGGGFAIWYFWLRHKTEKTKEEVFLLPVAWTSDTDDGMMLKQALQSNDTVNARKYYTRIQKASGFSPATLDDLKDAAKDGAAWCAWAAILTDNSSAPGVVRALPLAEGWKGGQCVPFNDIITMDGNIAVLSNKSATNVNHGIIVKGVKPALDDYSVLALPWKLDVDSSAENWENVESRKQQKSGFVWSKYSKDQ